jgi:hypothetical protein
MIRTTKVELFRFCAIDQENIDTDRRDAWKMLAQVNQQILNRAWQMWLVYHSANDSADKLKKHLDAWAVYKADPKNNKKPSWPVQCVPDALQKAIYKDITKRFAVVNVRTVSLQLQKWKEGLTTRKAASGSLPGWVSILFANEAVPSFTRPQPIPFDRQNATLSSDNGKLLLTLRIERLPAGTKKNKPSVLERCELMLNRRKTNSVRAIVERIISGEYTFKGSSLIFDSIKCKWFASIAYEMPVEETPKLDSGKTLYLIPGKKSPWVIKSVSKSGSDAWRFGGRGDHVTNFRRRIQRERNERKESYRWAGSNQKGHGRRRAEEVFTKLSARWRDFVKRYNNELTRKLVELCVNRRIGKIVYCQPNVDGPKRDRLFLARAGNDSRNGMSWEFFQVKTMLASKSEEFGIEFAIHGNNLPSVRKAEKAKPKRRSGGKSVDMR